MLKREWSAESNRKLPHLSIPSKIAVLVPEFSEEDLPLGKTAALVREFALKDLPLGKTLMMMMIKLFKNIFKVKFTGSFRLKVYNPPLYDMSTLKI